MCNVCGICMLCVYIAVCVMFGVCVVCVCLWYMWNMCIITLGICVVVFMLSVLCAASVKYECCRCGSCMCRVCGETDVPGFFWCLYGGSVEYMWCVCISVKE